jgi:hypothetical protein
MEIKCNDFMIKYVNTFSSDTNTEIKNKIKFLLENVGDLDSEDISNITKLLRKSKLKRIIDEK